MVIVSLRANFIIMYTQCVYGGLITVMIQILHTFFQSPLPCEYKFEISKKMESISLSIDPDISHVIYLAVPVRQKGWCGEQVMSLSIKGKLIFPSISLVCLTSPKEYARAVLDFDRHVGSITQWAQTRPSWVILQPATFIACEWVQPNPEKPPICPLRWLYNHYIVII